jgi:FtsP/CotA-like multicopper oxidase with cupredoxin domain
VSKVFVISRKQIRMAAVMVVVLALAAVYLRWNQSEAATIMTGEDRIFHLVTGEFKSVGKDGKEFEVYRWDPGTIVVERGQQVQLHITGVNGASHPFVIEGLGVRGEVRKGETTIVKFSADHPGTYPILCLTHTDQQQSGPMVGYIVVQ